MRSMTLVLLVMLVLLVLSVSWRLTTTAAAAFRTIAGMRGMSMSYIAIQLHM
eukprot:SAG25_NODE_385_length_8737_cov_82.994675_2_plen_52_part_00